MQMLVQQINSFMSFNTYLNNKILNSNEFKATNKNLLAQNHLWSFSECSSIIPFKGKTLSSEQKLNRELRRLMKSAGQITPDMINTKIAKLLLEVAKSATEKSYAKYSNFHVGAAVISRDGKIYKGCNVENASYGVALCAERNALSTMVAQDGYKQISALACAAKEVKGKEIWPCGACRQWLEEFDTDETAKIISENNGKPVMLTTKELLPNAFGPKDLLTN